MNSEVIVLLSSISTGVLALIALCIKFSILSKCSSVSLCWDCIKWTKPTIPSENTPTTTTNLENNNSNSNVLNNFSQV
jgi:hypothetical protein